MKKLLKSELKKYELIFFDFDGVIKDSNNIKTEAFRKLFDKYGKSISSKVVEHHKQNTGISRFEKIPYYYENFLNTKLDSGQIKKVNKEFSNIVMNDVINSKWIKYSYEFLLNNSFNQEFILITGTPQDEINYICRSLKINNCFKEIYGSPIQKDKVVEKYLSDKPNLKKHSIYIGDSFVDYTAAIKNRISFVYRLGDNANSGIKDKANFYIYDFEHLV